MPPAADPSAAPGHGVVVRGVEKAFGGQPVLGPVDLDAAGGAVTLATGDNGAGKTTLLRILATSLVADAGTATIDGLDPVRDGDAVRQRIGVALVNERSLFWRISATRNLDLFARIRSVPKAKRATHVAGLLEEVGLAEHARKPVNVLSAGQRQRVVLARALLGDPRVLLIDEPLRGLDRHAIDAVLGLLQRRAQTGVTVLVATPEAEHLADIAAATVRLPPPSERETVAPKRRRFITVIEEDDDGESQGTTDR